MSNDEDDELVDKVLLNRLRVIRKIGGGGMGAVYEVEHKLTGHRRALKVVRKRYAKEPRFMKRLLREAKVAGTLNSHYVVETLDAGLLDDGSAYVLMELLRGRSLLELLRDKERLEVEEVAWVATQVCEGLIAAHNAEIIHRDLKPDNIFVVPTPDDHALVKILDFGVSKFGSLADEPDRLTRDGTILGTPYYMSPEQASGKRLDPRTDLYSLGVVMYEALCGRLPFEASTVGALFIKIGNGEYIPLDYRRSDLDPGIVDLVHRAISKDRSSRFQSAREMQAALLPFCDGTLQAPGRATQRLAYMANEQRDRLGTVEFGSTEDRNRSLSVETMAAPGASSRPPPPRTPSSFPPAPVALEAAISDEVLDEVDVPLNSLELHTGELMGASDPAGGPEATSGAADPTVPSSVPARPARNWGIPIAIALVVSAIAIAVPILMENTDTDGSDAAEQPEASVDRPPAERADTPEPIPIERIELVAPPPSPELQAAPPPAMEGVAAPVRATPTAAAMRHVTAMRAAGMRLSDQVGLDQNPY